MKPRDAGKDAESYPEELETVLGCSSPKGHRMAAVLREGPLGLRHPPSPRSLAPPTLSLPPCLSPLQVPSGNPPTQELKFYLSIYYIYLMRFIFSLKDQDTVFIICK